MAQPSGVVTVANAYNLDTPSSPIETLPPEILSAVFWHTLPYRSSDYIDVAWHSPNYYATANTLTSSLVVSHVCQKWRTIALGTPNLWSDIHIETGSLSSRIVPVLSTMTSRSGALPLSLDISCTNYDEEQGKVANARHRIIFRPHTGS